MPDNGTKRAVSYFLSDDDACKLTLTLAEVVQDDELNGLTAARMTVAVEAGKVARAYRFGHETRLLDKAFRRKL